MVVIKRRSKKVTWLLPIYPDADAAPLQYHGACEEEEERTNPDAPPEHDSGPVEQELPADLSSDSQCSSASGNSIRVVKVSANALKWLSIHDRIRQAVAARHADMATEGSNHVSDSEAEDVARREPSTPRGSVVPVSVPGLQAALEQARGEAPAELIRRPKQDKASKGKAKVKAKARSKAKPKAKPKAKAMAGKGKRCAKEQTSDGTPTPAASPPLASRPYGGGLRLVNAASRTYITGRADPTSKWTLVVEVSDRMSSNHRAIVLRIRDELTANTSWGKDEAIRLRGQLLGQTSDGAP
jgi:hypothetical protein